MLSAESILKAQDIGAPMKVDVPEWGGHVFVRTMTGAERDRWELIADKAIKGNTSASVRASLLVMCLCDEGGKRVFGDGQVAALGNKSANVLDRLFVKARTLNKLSDDDIEELEGN